MNAAGSDEGVNFLSHINAGLIGLGWEGGCLSRTTCLHLNGAYVTLSFSTKKLTTIFGGCAFHKLYYQVIAIIVKKGNLNISVKTLYVP